MTEVENPQRLNLTRDELISRGMTPLRYGASWTLRFKVLDSNGSAVDLTDSDVVFTILKGETRVKFKSGVTTVGAALPQISIDDQSTIGETEGRGFFQINVSHVDAEVERLSGVAGRGSYDVVVVSPTGSQDVIASGLIDVAPRISTPE